MRLVFILIAGYAFISFAGAGRQAQNIINGGSFALRSGGSPSGDEWVLNANGYVGTYIMLDAPGSATLNVNALGFTDDATSPHMNIVVNDSVAGWEVEGGFNNYSTTLNLPAGAHFVRIEFNNDAPTANRTLTVRSLEALGGAISNTNSDANALAAAKTYIDNYRKGAVTVKLPSIAPGATAQVELISHAFNVGAITSGFTSYPDLADNPPPGSPAHSYQQFVNSHFNALVPSNGGKWAYNEEARDVVTMEAIDTFLNYASTHGMRARMHNLIWDAFRQLKGKIGSITFWGQADDHTWLTSSTRVNGPLLFDTSLKKKFAYWGVIDPLQLPGADLSTSVSANTNPALSGSDLSYTITVTVTDSAGSSSSSSTIVSVPH